MGDSKLCLLLILIISALAFAQDEDHPTCLLANRYKPLHKYEYQYEAESLNAINGASELKNGPRTSCKVIIEVPQVCSFIMHTTDCSLSEVVDADAEGNPVFLPAASSNAFAAEMKKHPLKFVIEGEYDVKLYPEVEETTAILNFKRGIVSALAVPLLEDDESRNMPTIHGKCMTSYKNDGREDSVTDISLYRDLSNCDKFSPIRDYNSPLALITGMHYPLAQLVRSSQTCKYQFDNEKKHMTSGSCTEEHLLIPFSHKGKYGFNNVGKQGLTLVQVSSHNDRVFEHDNIPKDLNIEVVEDKSPIQDKNEAVDLMRELVNLPDTDEERRAQLFYKLITTVRGMKTETLRAALPEIVTLSRFLTYQVLAQCGTPECSSTIMQILRTFDLSDFEVDAAVFALGLMSNPSELLITDMLAMAKHKPSRTIMYALSNVVKRFYKVEKRITPEIHSVAEFMASQLGDCTEEMENTFMTLRVIGNMATVVIPVSPALRSAVIQCVKQPAASPEVQQTAIQVFRKIPVQDEIRSVFMQVLLDNSNPVQERIAAYLIIMKDPQLSELTEMTGALSSEVNQQFKSFVISHITNILSSTEPETEALRQKIQDAQQGNEIGPTWDPLKFSQNYKIGSVQSNVIFEGVSYLPKEVMLEMTLKAIGFEIDMIEIGIMGEDFEPTVEALFGDSGFFPDTALKTIYFVSEIMPERINEIVGKIIPGMKRNRMKRESFRQFDVLMKEILRNTEKLVEKLDNAKSPEATVYLKLLGNELGYLKINDFYAVKYSADKMVDKMLKMFPHEIPQILRSLMTNTDTKISGHYIFMDNEFFLPTATGVPLRIALSGTFTPGFKGGLQIARDMSTANFMPVGGIEFVTQFGSHIPEYLSSGLEMHTNIFHESGIRARLTMGKARVKLTIPAPTKPTKLIRITNSLVAVTGSVVRMIPPVVKDKVDVMKCTPAFAGLKYCSALQYIDAFSHETAPYFPLNGDSRFAFELHPTGEVTEYTATVAYEDLMEGDEPRNKVDVLRFIFKVEGADPTEAQLVTKYNRGMNVITADVQIPDFDVEAGLRFGVGDGKTKGKGMHTFSIDFINKNIPQLSLVVRANLKDMKSGMLQVQLMVPSIRAESTVTASLKRDEELEVEVESEIKIMDAKSKQKIEMTYDGSKIELEFKSDVNTKTNSLPNGDVIQKYGNEILDMRVAQTDMKVRHIFRKFVEAANNYMEKYGAEILPYMQNFRLPDIPDIALPEKLFLNMDAKAVYHFNKDRCIIVFPLPFGGKKASAFNFPPVLTTPSMSLPQFGLEIVSREIPIPDFVIPENFTVSVPHFGKIELTTLMNSNLYDVEATLAAGKDVVEPPSYSAKFDAKGTSPIDILSVAVEGVGMVSITESIKAHLRSSLTHKLFEASFSTEDEGIITEKISLTSRRKIEASSQFGFNAKLEHNCTTELVTQEIVIKNDFEGSLKAGPIYGTTTSIQKVSVIPFRPAGKINSLIIFDSTIFDAQNKIDASLGNGEFSVNLNTKAFKDLFTHVAELSFIDNEVVVKCDASAHALGLEIRHQTEAFAGAGKATIRIETNGDHSDNRVYSLLTSTFDSNGLAVKSNANIKLFDNEATHEATMRMDSDGLSTSGINTLHSPLSLENRFSFGIDAKRGTLSISNKAAIHDIKIDNANTLTITLSSLDFSSQAEASAAAYASYNHDINFGLKHQTASAKINNHLKILEATFDNDAQLQAELYKIDLTGSLKAQYGEEEIKHTYQINYADLSANAKCNTIGKLFGTKTSHNTELEIAGFAAMFRNEAHFNSQLIRFEHTMRCNVVPFDFNLDSVFSGDGDLTIYGKHSAQLFSKFLLRAQPLALTSSHQCRASMTQKLDNGLSFETSYDNNIDAVLLPQEQITRFRTKSKMNEHEFNQGIDIYNTQERVGIEVYGNIFTNIINAASTENQEFAISGFLKYDKHTQSHIIYVPLIENLPVFLEAIKEIVVVVAESLQNFINNKEIRARFEALPQEISEFIAQFKIEHRINQVKEFFSDFKQNVINAENVDAVLLTLKDSIQILLKDLSSYIKNSIDFIGANLHESFNLKIEDVLEGMKELKVTVLHFIKTIREIIQEIDLEKLRGSSIEFLYDVEVHYGIKTKVQNMMTAVKDLVDELDFLKLDWFILPERVKDSVDLFLNFIPAEIIGNIIDDINGTINDFKLISKINKFFAKIRDLVVDLEVDQKAKALLEKAAEFIKMIRIQETLQVVVDIVKEFEVPNRFMAIFQGTIDYLKTTEVKDIIEHLNMYIETMVQKLKSLNYNDLVEKNNQIIEEYRTHTNEILRTLQVSEKIEAALEFANVIISSIRDDLERLREIKVAKIVNSATDIYEHLVCDSLKTFTEYIKVKVRDLNIERILSVPLDIMSIFYSYTINIITNSILDFLEKIKEGTPDEKYIIEVMQIIKSIKNLLLKAEINTPSFTFPLTDLVVPSTKLELNIFRQNQIPTELAIPEFTIMGMYTVEAFNISFDDIKQRIIELIDFIVNSKIKMPDPDAFFGELTLNYLPSLPEITFPEIPPFEVAFPSIPQIDTEKFFKALEIPEIKLPEIPKEIVLPCFGKLYGEIKFQSPIYTIKTSVEFVNSTENKMSPLFTGSFSSQATCPSVEILNYMLDTNIRIAVPKMKRVLLSEMLTFKHAILGIEHQASVTLYGILSQAQAQAKTKVKVVTAPYSLDFMNTAFIAVAEGMTSTVDTTYSHKIDMPFDISSIVTVTQKAVVQQKGLALNFEVDTTGKGHINSNDCNYKSRLDLSLNPKTFSLSFTGDTESEILKMKQVIMAESLTFSYVKFSVRNEAETPFIKKSLLVASGLANLYDMKIEIKVNHDTELHGTDSGMVSNAVNFKVALAELFFEMQNKANGKVNVFDYLNAKIELQSDYLVNLRHDSQKVNSAFLSRLNQYKIFSNFTVDNTKSHAGVFVEMDGQADLSFLEYPISIPEIDLPLVDFHSQPINDLNLFEKTGLKKILSTTEQTYNLDAKILYLKSDSAPLIDVMGLIQIPYMGKLNSELSFKSAILNINAESLLFAEDDLVLRLGATTTSVFECLNTKLKGSTSLTIKSGIKVANSISLENCYIKGAHDSTYSMSTVSASTSLNIVLPVLNLEASQKLIANSNLKPNALSTLKLKGDFNIPMIKTVGQVEAEHSGKVEGDVDHLSVDSSFKSKMDSTYLEKYLVLGVLENEANMYLNTNIVRSTYQIIADVKLSNGATKIIGMDVNQQLAAEASVDHLFAMLTHSSNNEIDLFSFKTVGKHNAKTSIDCAPSSLQADVEIDITQPSSLGNFALFEKAIAEGNPSKQKFSTKAMFVSPLYNTSMQAEVEGSAPVLNVTFKSSANSAIVLLEYNVEGSTTFHFENDLLNMVSNLVLTHSDLGMDVNHVIVQALSVPQHKLSVVITSPNFSDLNLQYEAQRDAITASISSPSAGYLGLQFNSRDPSQTIVRFYGRYVGAAETDVDILLVRFSQTNIQIVYNMKAPEDMIAELKTKVPSIMSSVKAFAEKYQITSSMEVLQHSLINHVNEAYDVAVNYDVQLSQLSIFFRNTIVRYQKNVEKFLKAVIKVLREIHFKMPGSNELITLPDLLKKLTNSIANMLDVTMQFIYECMEVYYEYFLENIINAQVQLRSGEVISGRQIIDQVKASVKNIFHEAIDLVKNIETLDTILGKLDDTLEAVVKKTKEFVDSIKSDYLDVVFINLNDLYREVVTSVKKIVDQMPPFNLDEISKLCQFILDRIIELIVQFNDGVSDFLQQTSEEVQAQMAIRNGKLEINLPFHFQD
ncbi:apolipoprotein Bb, tandem duplicate 1 [Cyprinodon tularosa]|uniref:apolipoprotein Bb, tandem duplicate 1 n=1 Tax=Cyprinodon tularosa TaxID=77115 RepID=UPI0018E2288B|nr:apolipoprotein Bb, tandem duplicate 1 [Cyprinodon tularosa]XP_038134622.1 apolipoprotein Bb, tandem duplicate 1 [Cyprinodon tularosa]